MNVPFFRRAEADLHRWLDEHPEVREDADFTTRLATTYPSLYRLFYRLYGGHGEASELFSQLLLLLRERWQERDTRLREIDRERLLRGSWYRDGSLVGMQLYVDRFAGTLEGIREELDYFQDLGVNMLHLMPLLQTPDEHNDGGYAVSDYGAVESSLGTMEDLRSLSRTMHSRDMVLVLDYVLNHTSDEHRWAQAALAGDEVRQDYYFMYADRVIPDMYESALPEVFPETAPGNFTWRPEIGRWVMTVFHSYQWDLNYSNPRVLLEMTGILLDLANQGVDILRLDAVPYLWKRIGTGSQNLPEAHVLVRLLNACARVAAPGTAFIAEAIVQPREIARYFGEDEWAGRECELAYNASLMVLLWDALATHRTSLLRRGLRELPQPPMDSAWLNYLRCHDDIGLGYDEDHIRSQGWDPAMHRDFIVRYYTGDYPGSPARGARFMYNPKNGDARISGTAASLAGIEAALEADEADLLERAIARHLAL
ncbi:MAG: alpha-amylase, partial [Spirochaetaceae bacterium]